MTLPDRDRRGLRAHRPVERSPDWRPVEFKRDADPQRGCAVVRDADLEDVCWLVMNVTVGGVSREANRGVRTAVADAEDERRYRGGCGHDRRDRCDIQSPTSLRVSHD